MRGVILTLKSVRDIGRSYSGGNDIDRLLSTFPPYVKVKENQENVQVVRVNLKRDNEISLKNVDCAYLKNDPHPFLYKALQGNDKSPLSPTIVLKSYEYGEKNKDPLITSLKNYSNFIKQMNSEFLNELSVFLDENAERISVEISEKIKTFKNKSAIITFTFDSDGNILYPADSEDILDAFLKSNENKNFKTASCCVCGKTAPIFKKRLSDIEIFKFATVEKLGFLPNMNGKNVDKILPICESCYKDMQLGSKIILKNLDFSFYFKDKVWVIPKSLKDDLKVLKQTIESAEKIRSVNLDKESIKHRSFFEKRILDNAQAFSDYITMDFIFYRMNNAQRQVILNIQDVPLTWIKEISNAMLKVDTLYKKIAGENYNFGIGTIYDLTVEKSKNPRTKDFYLIIRSIFEKRKANRHLIISNAMMKIRSLLYSSLKEKKDYKYGVYDTMAVLDLFRFLNGNEKGEKMISNLSGEELELDKKVDEFFNNNFDTAEKKGLFYLGVLVGRLVACQQRKMDKSKAPFYSQLKGLRMKKEDFKGLYSKVLNKIIEYSSYTNCYLDTKSVDIIKRLCAYYLNLSKDWVLNIDEANFIFASGMTLAFAEPLKIAKGEDSDGKVEKI